MATAADKVKALTKRLLKGNLSQEDFFKKCTKIIGDVYESGYTTGYDEGHKDGFDLADGISERQTANDD